MKSKKNKKNFSNLFVFLCFVLLGFICGYIIPISINNTFGDNLSTGKILFYYAIAFIELYIAVLLQTIIHEVGHLIAGILTGYTFSSFRIASFMWVKTNGKIKLRRHSLLGTGGQCLMNPPDMVNQKIPFVLYNLGGALLNFITIPVCALLILAFGRVSYNSLFLFFMCVSGFFSALSNGIPMKLGMINNDGYNAKEIAASPEAMKAFWVQMKIVQSASEGVRFKDMPAEWFWLPDENGMKNSMNADIAVFYENRLMDKLLFSEASELIDRLLEEESSIIGLHKHLLICDRLYCELVGEKNIDVINKLYNKEQINFMKRMPNFITVIRTEYVYMLLYAQNVEKAAQIKARFEKFEKVHPYASDVESERELIDTAEQLFYNKKGNQSI